MNNVLLGLKTNPELLSKLQQTAAHKPSATEILEQRVSFVYGSMKPSSEVTRERVRQVILEQDGSVDKK